ncbi:indolepyruvate ferredoxin oxidoreductase subunit alpha [Thermodesulfobacteriota bacterium]
MTIIVEIDKCQGCGNCIHSCPEEALEVPSSFVVEIDEGKCIECLVCLDYCPNEALKEE